MDVRVELRRTVYCNVSTYVGMFENKVELVEREDKVECRSEEVNYVHAR